AIKAGDPALIHPGGKGKRDEAISRPTSHRGDVAEAAGARLVADIFGFHVAGEMHRFDREIRCEQQVLVAGSGQHGAIVSYEFRVTPQLANDRVFVHVVTSPEGSSSPKIRAASSCSSPSRTGSRFSGMVRRTTARVAGGRSRVVSPVRRAIAMSASCDFGIFTSASTQRVAVVAGST